MIYVLYDPIVSGYLKQTFGKAVPDWRDAKQYKRLSFASSPSTGAGLMNTGRNVPPGHTANHKYQNLPNVEVHEYDMNGNFVRSHAAPPDYISL